MSEPKLYSPNTPKTTLKKWNMQMEKTDFLMTLSFHTDCTKKKTIKVEIQTQATRTINIIGMLLQNVLV